MTNVYVPIGVNVPINVNISISLNVPIDMNVSVDVNVSIDVDVFTVVKPASLGCGPVLLSLGSCIECLRQRKTF